MKEEDYFKKTKELNKLFKSPSLMLKDRILRNSQDTTSKKKVIKKLPLSILMIFAFSAVMLTTLYKKQDATISKYVTNESYVANFNLKNLNLDEASYIELELPDNINIVSKNKKILKKKNFIFVWSVFSESKIVSFPFKAVEKGQFDLEIKILNKDMEVIDTKSITLDVKEG